MVKVFGGIGMCPSSNHTNYIQSFFNNLIIKKIFNKKKYYTLVTSQQKINLGLVGLVN